MAERSIVGGPLTPVFIYNAANAGVKTSCGSIITMDIGIAAVHMGIAFRFCYYTSSLSALADHYIYWLIGSKNCHATSVLSTSGQARIRVYNNPSISSNGTGIPIYNLNLSRMDISSLTRAFYEPTIADLGSQLIRDELIPGGSTGSRVGSVSRDNTELVIAANSGVLVRITNISQQDIIFSYTGTFFEEQ